MTSPTQLERVVGSPSAPYDVIFGSVLSWPGRSALFLDDMLPALWDAAREHDLDPVGVVAQSLKETGAGTFGRKTKPWYFNTCGLKVHDLKSVMALIPTTDAEHPLCHAQFGSWPAGATAQCQHLCAYAGHKIHPDDQSSLDGPLLDPRWHAALKTKPADWVVTWSQLGGKWAPAADYGTRIEKIMRQLRGEEPV